VALELAPPLPVGGETTLDLGAPSWMGSSVVGVSLEPGTTFEGTVVEPTPAG
jgi:hypothetical protein